MKHSLPCVPYLLNIIIILVSCVNESFGQEERKELIASRVSTPPVIDGVLNDEAWSGVNEASGFYQWRPYNDRPATFDTYVKVVYNDEAIFIGASMHDPYPDSIYTELGVRDKNEDMNADRFYFDINPFNDGVHGYAFMVTASGVQTDINRSAARRGPRGSDGSAWDAAWWSHVQKNKNGWVAEMKIPYSALRFPKSDNHVWGINFYREIRRYQEISSWNYIKRGVGSPLNYLGLLTGISGIKPPLRLSFFPYLSGYVEKDVHEKSWRTKYNGGMDLKWGINEGFTLDMTLIPDFGQVRSDEKVLNLTPYEVRYDEKRQFFTEGTQLFQRANLFYSRRIGSEPRGYPDIEDDMRQNEVIESNPQETRLINATKLSGRTKSGLGIGVLNAMTLESRAVLLDTVNRTRREVVTQPFTNYNIFVLDQSLPNNSSVSLVNTNTMMDRSYMVNITGTEFNFRDKTNEYGLRGEGAFGQIYEDQQPDIFGYKYDIRAGKLGGEIRYFLRRQEVSDQYDQNALGYQRRNNTIENRASFEYNIFDPFGIFLDFSSGLDVEYNQLYKPRTFTELRLSLDARGTFINQYRFFSRAQYRPVGVKDYFEPRVEGRFYQIDPSFEFFIRLETDPRKNVALGGDFHLNRIYSPLNQNEFGFQVSPRFRINDQFNFTLGTEYIQKNNDIGYVVDFSEDSIYFGNRQSPTLINEIDANYIFTNTMSLGFKLRHYWARVNYDNEYYFLNEDGTLTAFNENLNIDDINYNAFTIDMAFKWNFAPASWLSVVWKNVVDSERYSVINNYFDNVNQMFRDNQLNSFSVKVLYYLDYQYINHALHK